MNAYRAAQLLDAAWFQERPYHSVRLRECFPCERMQLQAPYVLVVQTSPGVYQHAAMDYMPEYFDAYEPGPGDPYEPFDLQREAFLLAYVLGLEAYTVSLEIGTA